MKTWNSEEVFVIQKILLNIIDTKIANLYITVYG